MEITLLIIVLIICVLLYLNINSLKDENTDLKYKLDNLLHLLKSNAKDIETLKEFFGGAEIKKDQNVVLNNKTETIITEVKSEPIIENPTPVIEEIEEEKPVFTPKSYKPESIFNILKPNLKETEVETEVKPSFWERNPDLEKFVGENLINKIGIAILVLGIGFFVKFAIDQNWINEIGRVSIGIFCGGILLGIAHKLRNTFRPFSSVLIGGGIAVFYFTIAIAYKDYALFPKPAAFAMMVVITAFAVLLSIIYNRIEIAMIAIFGGFISPFFVSDGNGSYIALFVYLIVLNLGMLVLAYFKRWNLINITSYVFTIITYFGWLQTKVLDQPNPPYVGALIFATIFYLIFFLMNIINNIKENQRFVWTEFSIILSNSMCYYAIGMLIFSNIEQGIYKGIFTVLVAVFNFAFAYTLFKFKKVDANILYMLLGLVLTFATLAAPIQLEGSYITMFWALEGVLLLWLAQKSEIYLIKIAHLAILPLTIFSLIMDWNSVYSSYYYAEESLFYPFINKGFITNIIVSISLILQIYLYKNEQEIFIWTIKTSLLKNLLHVLLISCIYYGLYLELNYQLYFAIGNIDINNMYLAIYNFGFALALFYYLKKIITKPIFYVVLSISVLLLIKLFFMDITTIFNIIDTYYIYNQTDIANADKMPMSDFHFYMHIVLYGLALFYFYKIYKNITDYFEDFEAIKQLTTVLYAFLLILLFSFSLNHQIIFWFFDSKSNNFYELQNTIVRVGFPILWGIGSFVFMIIGMKNKLRIWRIISLVLFAITLLKLFIYDISEMGEAGKIIAFIGLGVILLIVSFMYQKLKNIVINENETNL